MTEDGGSLPGTVIAAIALAGFNAFFGLFFPPVGFIWTMIYGSGAVGTGMRRVWGYWMLVMGSGGAWLLGAVNGQFEVIGTTTILFILLMTPSARATFGLRQA